MLGSDNAKRFRQQRIMYMLLGHGTNCETRIRDRHRDATPLRVVADRVSTLKMQANA